MLQMRFREVKPLAQGHTSGKSRGLDLNSRTHPYEIVGKRHSPRKSQAELRLESGPPTCSLDSKEQPPQLCYHICLPKPLTSNLRGSDPHSVDTASHSVPNSLEESGEEGNQSPVEATGRQGF